MPEIFIKNRKFYKDEGIYVGRGTPLGNPFQVGIDGTREEIIDKYENYLEMRFNDGTEQYTELRRLAEIVKNKNLILICSCVPLRCHAEIIAKFIRRIGQCEL